MYFVAGGGDGGMSSFMSKIGGTVQNCWDVSAKDYDKYDIEAGKGEAWEEKMCRQCEEEYGNVDTAERDAKTRKVLEAAAVTK